MLRQCARNAADVLAPFAFAVLTLFTLLQPLAAQDSLPLAPGARVRVSAPNLGVQHRLAHFTERRGDTLVFRSADADSMIWQLPLQRIERLEVSRGRRSGAVALGVALGLVGGGAIGGTLGYVGSRGDRYQYAATVGAGIVGAVVGLMVGGAIGAHYRERWERVSLPRRVSVVPRWSPNGAFGLSATLTF
jgi:hypothetical protein